MTDDSSRVFREAREAASGPFSSLVERLGDRVSARSGAANVFGEPIERDGVTVIPVARVRWGFGGGSGSSAEDRDGPSGEGSGGGAGLAASPIGFIQVANGRASFHRIWDPSSLVPLVLASAFSTWVAARALARLRRR